MKYLIVGLGNIGTEYQETRHNMGFMILDAFAKASNIAFETKRYGGVESLDNSGLRLYVDQSGLVSFTLYEEALAQVFDLKGRCLYSELMPEGRGSVDLSSYSNGIYLVSVAGQTVKVMKR